MCAQVNNHLLNSSFRGLEGKHPKDLSIKEFTYDLPDEAIAKYPLVERDSSKLLVYKNDMIEESDYSRLADHLPVDSLLVFNNTKVVKARLLFQKENGSSIEIFCLEPHEQYTDISSAMLEKGKIWWKCLIGGAKKWKQGSLKSIIQTHPHTITLTAKKIEQLSDCYIVEFNWEPSLLCFAEVLHKAGRIPLPPYLNRADEEADKETYQTIYAQKDGSVAAPTAGLHFTERLFTKLTSKNIQHAFISLHVGAGTFKPVKSETMQLHEMHAEYIEVSKAFIENLLESLPKNIIAVGTTSLRTLESLYWLGLQTKQNPMILASQLMIAQWEPYETVQDTISAADALQSLLTWLEKQPHQLLITKTQIIIAPGYRFRIVKGLITNFHQPQSTLLLLVAAMIGNNWKKVYDYALQHSYRFLSYGDGCLIWLG